MSSPTSASGASRLTNDQKKANHIASEAKRREMIREGFDSLASLVPGMEGQGRSEAVVLQATVQFLREQLEEQEQLQRAALARGVSQGDVDRIYGGGNAVGSGGGRRGSRVGGEGKGYEDGEGAGVGVGGERAGEKGVDRKSV